MKRTLPVFASLALTAHFALPAAVAAESTQAKIERATSAGPSAITAKAAVIDMDSNGRISVLRRGNNGWTCYSGHVGVTADDPFCADTPGMRWTMDWMNHKPKPTNTAPGTMYMFRGGTDWSAYDPWATKGTPIHEPPHWMILWPYAASSGLPTRLKNAGTWIMWPGTPYAHLMINQVP